MALIISLHGYLAHMAQFHTVGKIISGMGLTDAQISSHTLLVKYYNDLPGRQSSERGRDEVTYFYVGDLFCIHLGTKYANFQEKIFAEISGKKFQTFHCSNVTIMKSLGIFSRNLCGVFS